MITQQCTGPCQAWLPMASFGFHKGNGKHNPRCKHCLADAARAYRQTHGDQLKQKERARNVTRRDYIRAWQAQHRATIKAGQAARRRVAKSAAAGLIQPQGGRGSKSSGDPSPRP